MHEALVRTARLCAGDFGATTQLHNAVPELELAGLEMFSMPPSRKMLDALTKLATPVPGRETWEVAIPAHSFTITEEWEQHVRTMMESLNAEDDEDTDSSTWAAQLCELRLAAPGHDVSQEATRFGWTVYADTDCDTKAADGATGSVIAELDVFLPCKHTGGVFEVQSLQLPLVAANVPCSRRLNTETYCMRANSVAYAVYRRDCLTRLTPVTSGCVLYLKYVIRTSAPSASAGPSPCPSFPTLRPELRDALADSTAQLTAWIGANRLTKNLLLLQLTAETTGLQWQHLGMEDAALTLAVAASAMGTGAVVCLADYVRQMSVFVSHHCQDTDDEGDVELEELDTWTMPDGEAVSCLGSVHNSYSDSFCWPLVRAKHHNICGRYTFCSSFEDDDDEHATAAEVFDGVDRQYTEQYGHKQYLKRLYTARVLVVVPAIVGPAGMTGESAMSAVLELLRKPELAESELQRLRDFMQFDSKVSVLRHDVRIRAAAKLGDTDYAEHQLALHARPNQWDESMLQLLLKEFDRADMMSALRTIAAQHTWHWRLLQFVLDNSGSLHEPLAPDFAVQIVNGWVAAANAESTTAPPNVLSLVRGSIKDAGQVLQHAVLARNEQLIAWWLTAQVQMIAPDLIRSVPPQHPQYLTLKDLRGLDAKLCAVITRIDAEFLVEGGIVSNTIVRLLAPLWKHLTRLVALTEAASKQAADATTPPLLQRLVDALPTACPGCSAQSCVNLRSWLANVENLLQEQWCLHELSPGSLSMADAELCWHLQAQQVHSNINKFVGVPWFVNSEGCSMFVGRKFQAQLLSEVPLVLALRGDATFELLNVLPKFAQDALAAAAPGAASYFLTVVDRLPAA